MTQQRQLVLKAASTFKSQRQCWLSENRVPLGTTTLAGGKGGEGKSTFLLHVAAQTTRGTLNGEYQGTPKSVIIVSHEDDWGMVMKPRLIAAGADLDKVFQLAIEWREDEVTGESIPSFPMDMGALREAIDQTGAALVIIDPITSTLDGDLHKVVDVRRALDPLAQVAQEKNVAVVGLMHFNKGQGNASDKLSGSHAFRDAVRSVLLFATDDETGNRVVSIDKSNYSKSRGSSFAFRLVSVQVPTDDGQIAEVARVEELGASDVSVSDIINREAHSDDDSGNETERWLIGFLEDHGGVAKAADVKKAALADGMEWRTVQRWSKRLTTKDKTGFQGAWSWTLDLTKGDTKDACSPGSGAFGTFGTFEGDTPLNPRHKDAIGAKDAIDDSPMSTGTYTAPLLEAAGLFS